MKKLILSLTVASLVVFTSCKENAAEKIDQEKRDEEDIAKGIVKFFVDIYDQDNETVGVATILTMVKKLDQSM